MQVFRRLEKQQMSWRFARPLEALRGRGPERGCGGPARPLEGSWKAPDLEPGAAGGLGEASGPSRPAGSICCQAGGLSQEARAPM